MIISTSRYKLLDSSDILKALTHEMHEDRDACRFLPPDPWATGFSYWSAWLRAKYQVKSWLMKDSSGAQYIKLEDGPELTMLLLTKNLQKP